MDLAVAMGAEIVSADSMLVYRGMDIGTAKPLPEERARVPHHALDLANPDEPFNAARYRAAAIAALRDIRARGRTPLVAGGTGLYVKALTHGLGAAPAAEPALRAELESILRTEGLEALQARLRNRAPRLFAALVDPKNPRRLIRALELAQAGITEPPADWRSESHRAVLTGLRMEAGALRRRIVERVERMYAAGLLDEVRSLLHRGRLMSATARQAIGYREALDCAEGRCSREDAMRKTAVRTWQLSRRQMTWFQRQAEVNWIDVDPAANSGTIAAYVQESWRKHGPTPIRD